MADVLGTAAGVVSPGLHVSQGIVSYYSAYRDQADEIDGIAQRTQALHTTLKGLQASLGSLHSNHTSAITLVAATVASCADNIRTLETTLQKCQLSVPIENIVCKLQANVDMAIMALQLLNASFTHIDAILPTLKDVMDRHLQYDLRSRLLNQYMVPELSNVRMALQGVPEIVEQATPRALNLNQKQLAATVDNTSSKALIPDSDDRAFETSIRKNSIFEVTSLFKLLWWLIQKGADLHRAKIILQGGRQISWSPATHFIVFKDLLVITTEEINLLPNGGPEN
ncbi:hypothetical protein BELL_0275g00020 [Botrytis elliptica]|uniref:Fungal N-terminal domain-containing protein n=1 Tax=Botrytis elliptica TaxID=278938 RepID=A0A4Z1JZY0_9HELO|nr:hypothetical protein EAE99_005652 [Botrytis elliptica]TGO74517.1 hypothetical protein BELL_0275g00020 [Botrytis elliptica]